MPTIGEYSSPGDNRNWQFLACACHSEEVPTKTQNAAPKVIAATVAQPSAHSGAPPRART